MSEHVYRFRQALDVSRHPFWEGQASDDLDAYCEFVRTTPLRLGIEADFVAGSEDRIANLLEREFDYVLGSVHLVGDRMVDHGGYDMGRGASSADGVWERYFELVAEAVRSGLFDILAHPDLVKMWGPERPWPERDLRFHYEPAVEAIAESGIAVELSTAGLRKPSARSTRRASCARCASTRARCSRSSSDAHAPDTSATSTVARWTCCGSWSG